MRIRQVLLPSATLALGATCLQLLKLCHALCHNLSITQGLEGVDGLKAFSFTFPSRVQSYFLSSPWNNVKRFSMGTMYTAWAITWLLPPSSGTWGEGHGRDACEGRTQLNSATQLSCSILQTNFCLKHSVLTEEGPQTKVFWTNIRLKYTTIVFSHRMK